MQKRLTPAQIEELRRLHAAHPQTTKDQFAARYGVCRRTIQSHWRAAGVRAVTVAHDPYLAPPSWGALWPL